MQVSEDSFTTKLHQRGEHTGAGDVCGFLSHGLCSGGFVSLFQNAPFGRRKISDRFD